MAGDDADPAVPGYDPDISAELYTINGETAHAGGRPHTGRSASRPEMSTCQTASDANPDDEWLAEDCLIGLRLPRRRGPHPGRVRQERAVRARRGAVRRRPGRPRLGGRPDGARPRAGRVRATPTARTQPVAVTGQASPGRQAAALLRQRGTARGRPASRSGTAASATATGYDRLLSRSTAAPSPGLPPGDSVRGVVHRRSAARPPSPARDFTYQVATDIGGDVLVLAAEDVTGASPVQGRHEREVRRVVRRRPRGRRLHLGRLRRRHPWSSGSAPPRGAVALRRGRLGDRRRHHSASASDKPAGTAAPLALDLELTVRDYLNEGGKAARHGQVQPVRPGGGRRLLVQPVRASAVHDAERVPVPAAAQRLPAVLAGGLRLPRRRGRGPRTASPCPLLGDEGAFAGFEATLNGAGSADNQDHTAAFLTTSSLPAAGHRSPSSPAAAPVDWVRPGSPRGSTRYSGDWSGRAARRPTRARSGSPAPSTSPARPAAR